ncbi:MAG: hypothetical protein PHG03_03745 [Bacilli bacterium]|nr:hypothetical protein [Bacilli bacterium]MDD4795654.1 hypothetical protein [Bacilli bacterium]
MGVFKRLKDVLFDVEEELPVITKKEKEEEIKIPKFEEENTIKEIKIPKEELSERELMKSDPTFNFPLDVDEGVSRSNRSFKFEEETVKSDVRDFSRMFSEEPEKSKEKFKPTPIISPVYGILDQNYSKDDIIVKTDIGVKGPNLDEVRKKAYGINSKKESPKAEKPVKEVEEPLKTLDEILMHEEEKPLKKEEIKQVIDDELPDQPYSDEKDLNIENTIETDLFNLIDSMYEDKKESEE